MGLALLNISTSWNFLGTVCLVLHCLWLHHCPADCLLHLYLMPCSWAGVQLFTRKGFLTPTKSEQGFVWQLYTRHDEGSDASSITICSSVFLISWDVHEGFLVVFCLCWQGCRASVLPIIEVVILVLCLFGWKFAVGSTLEGPGMTCFSLGWRGWAFFTMESSPNAAVCA